MGGFGSVWHWVIVLLVILLLFGAKKIPELAKGLGSGIKNFKKAVKEDEEEDEQPKPKAIQEPQKKRGRKASSTKALKAAPSTKTTSKSKTATKASKEPVAVATPKRRGRPPRVQKDA